jgi:hypothetical protein
MTLAEKIARQAEAVRHCTATARNDPDTEHWRAVLDKETRELHALLSQLCGGGLDYVALVEVAPARLDLRVVATLCDEVGFLKPTAVYRVAVTPGFWGVEVDVEPLGGADASDAEFLGELLAQELNSTQEQE